jgi:hypothetical protein
VVGVRGFEPPAPCSQGRCASQAALHPDSRTQFIAQHFYRCKLFPRAVCVFIERRSYASLLCFFLPQGGKSSTGKTGTRERPLMHSHAGAWERCYWEGGQRPGKGKVDFPLPDPPPPGEGTFGLARTYSAAKSAALRSCMARPRWLMAFLISSGSSEKVWPYSGTRKRGS